MGTLRGFGSSVVGQSVLRAISDSGSGHAVLAFVPQEWEPGPSGAALERTSPGLLAKLTLENATLRSRLRSWRADVLFSMGDTSLVACPVPHLLMVQQAYLAHSPAALDFPMSREFRARMRAMSWYLRAGLATVGHVTVQSQHMAFYFADRWGFDPARVHVIPSGVQEPCLARAAAGPSVPDDSQAPYLAYVSSASPHKNHVVLAPMMASLARSHPDLLCRVTVTPESVPALVDSARALGVLDRFRFDGSLRAEATMDMLAGAMAAVIPSKLESFGIPYYEAMCLGLPVVAADREPAREPLGAAGLLADADSGPAFADAVRRALGERDEWSRRSRARFAAVHVPWDEIGRRYLRLIEAIG